MLPFKNSKEDLKAMARQPAMSTHMLMSLGKNHKTSRWTHTESYNEIYSRLNTVKEYIEKNETILDSLTMREKTFLRWQIEAIRELVFHGADTEEEEEEEIEEDSGVLNEMGLFSMD